MKLRNHLIVLVVATLLPVVLFTLVLVIMVHREQRATVQRGLLETARALAVALDGELRGYIRTLEALADSEHLDSGDLRKFYDVAARARRHHPDWETVLLVARSGQQLINLRRPFGAPLPDTPGNDAAFREVMHSGHPVITGIFPGPVAGHPVVGIRVPVVRNGRAQFMLSAGIAPRSFARILSRQRVPADWTAAVVDQNKVIVARNRAEERFVGQPVTADLQRAIDEMGEGSVVARNQEGERTYAGFSRSAMAGWTVVLGRPAAEVDAALARSLWAVLGAGAAVLALGVGVAAVLGRRIAAPIARLSEAAAAISAGDVPPARSGSAVAEIDGVSAALDRAGRLVHEQAAELRAREQQLRLVTDAVPVLISYIDSDGRYVFNNRGYEEWFGHPREALRGRAVREVLGGAAFEAVRPHLDAARAGQEVTFEARFPHRDGSTRHVQATFVPDRGADGPVRGLISLVRDVTGERAAAAQLREQAETLETVNRVGQLLSGELDLERLVQGLTDAATHLTRAAYGAFFYNVVDASGERYTLYTLAGAPRDAFKGFPMPRNTRLFAATFRGETVVRLDDVRADPRFGRNPPHNGMPAGHLPVRSYLAVPVVSRSGEVLGGLFFGHPEPGVFRERDERLVVALAAQAAVAMDNARLYEREQRARAEAEAASRAKDEFLATLSHELRTPLNAILGWTRMLRGGQLDGPSVARALEVIDRNAIAQNQLIEDLLDVSRIVAGKLRLEPRPTALGPVVEAAVETLRPAAAAKEIALHTDLEPAVGPVLADPARLQQVVWNLVSNALKFTPRYGRVEVRLARAGEHAEIEVSDTGQGISAEVLPHVFERFRQGDSTTTRRHGGLGLGLALARHLVEMQGGSIEARSDGEGRGAAFTVRLPLLPPDGRDRSGLSAPRAAAPLPADIAALLARVSVLVVDDDADALAMVGTVLESAGADVLTAGSAAEALAILADRRVDVLVSDLAMPGESGHDLIRKLRGLPAGAGGAVAALAITAYGSIEDRVRLIAAGFDAYLAKPLDPTELAATVGALAARAGRAR